MCTLQDSLELLKYRVMYDSENGLLFHEDFLRIYEEYMPIYANLRIYNVCHVQSNSTIKVLAQARRTLYNGMYLNDVHLYKLFKLIILIQLTRSENIEPRTLDVLKN